MTAERRRVNTLLEDALIINKSGFCSGFCLEHLGLGKHSSVAW